MADDRVENNIILEGVRIGMLNFAGKASQYNREGNRNFSVFLPENIAEDLAQDGWPVKATKVREEGDEPTPFLNVVVNYRASRPPKIVMVSSRGETILDEDTVDMLDWAEIKNVDMIIRPYNWDVNGLTGVKPYLKTMYVTIEEDELELKYASRGED